MRIRSWRSITQATTCRLVSDAAHTLSHYAALLIVLSCLVITACGGGSDPADPVAPSDSPNQPTSGPLSPGLNQDQTPAPGELGEVAESFAPSQPVPSSLMDIDRVGLRINSASRCSLVGDDIDLSVTRAPNAAQLAAGDIVAPTNLTAYVNLRQSLGSSLQLLSRVDELARFTMRQQDVVGLIAELDNGSVTAYLAAFNADTPASVVLRKPVPGGCMYALRLPDYCAVSVAKGGTLNFRFGDQGISAQGCELSNPGGFPVIDLPPSE